MIPISRPSEYAIRALTYLARQTDGEYSLTHHMAGELQIPGAFLRKCLQPLIVRGFLESQRGRNGGFRLASSPETVTLHQIVDALEHLERPRQCILGQAECSDERACPMHEYWREASNDFTEVLRSTTLADVSRFCDEKPGSGYPSPSAEDRSTSSA